MDENSYVVLNYIKITVAHIYNASTLLFIITNKYRNVNMTYHPEDLVY